MIAGYDGTTARNVELKRRFNLTTPASWSKYNKLACNALGIERTGTAKDGNLTPAQNVAIVEWLADYFTQPKKQKPIKKKRVKTKRGRYSAFTSIAFSVTGIEGRHNVSLEPEFIRALDLIAPTSRNKWLSECVSDYIAKNGIESTTRIIKSSIVNELVRRATVAKK